jgi:phage baseplate assembly protein W
MKSLKIEGGDIVIENGELVVIDGEEEEAQCIERVLTTNQGEWFLNLLHGLDYTHIFAKPFDEDRARLSIIEAIHQDPRVESVEEVEFQFDRAKRHMTVYVQVKMRGGNTIEEVIPLG